MTPCAGRPELFDLDYLTAVGYPLTDLELAMAAADGLRACQGCPMAGVPCLEQTDPKRGYFTGVCGGFLFRQGRLVGDGKVPKYTPRKWEPELLPHGTKAAIKRHERAGEPMCPICVDGAAIRRQFSTDDELGVAM